MASSHPDCVFISPRQTCLNPKNSPAPQEIPAGSPENRSQIKVMRIRMKGDAGASAKATQQIHYRDTMTHRPPAFDHHMGQKGSSDTRSLHCGGSQARPHPSLPLTPTPEVTGHLVLGPRLLWFTGVPGDHRGQLEQIRSTGRVRIHRI